MFSSVELLGVRVDVVSVNEFLSSFEPCIDKGKKMIVSYINVHALNLSYSTPWYRGFLNDSDITFCDGFGVKLGSLITGQKIQHRFTPPDFIDRVAELAFNSKWRIFFLGSRPGVAQAAADRLEKKIPGLQIKTFNGYFDKTYGSNDNNQVIKQINDFNPQLLIVGFGMPLQEKWILENFEELQVNIAFSAGALFDYMTGEVRRAPRWMTDHGMEWLGRLIVEPRRLWKRYIIGNPLFFWRVFIHHILKVPLPNKTTEEIYAFQKDR